MASVLSGSASAAAVRVGRVLREAREAQLLSQDQLAAMVVLRQGEISRSAISSIERGRHLPGLEALVGLCSALHLEPDVVLDLIRTPLLEEDNSSEKNDAELEKSAESSFWAGDYRSAVQGYDRLLARLSKRSGKARRQRMARIQVSRSTALRRCGALRSGRIAAECAVQWSKEPSVLSKAYVGTASIVLMLGNAAIAADMARRAVATAARADATCRGIALLELGTVLFEGADYAEACRVFARARDELKEGTDPRHSIAIEGNIGLCLREDGHYGEAMKRLARAAERARRAGAVGAEAHWLVALARTSLDRNELEAGEQYASAAARLARRHDHRLTLFRSLWIAHRIAERRGTTAGRRHRLAHLRRLFAATGQHKGVREVAEFRSEMLRLPMESSSRPFLDLAGATNPVRRRPSFQGGEV